MYRYWYQHNLGKDKEILNLFENKIKLFDFRLGTPFENIKSFFIQDVYYKGEKIEGLLFEICCFNVELEYRVDIYLQSPQTNKKIWQGLFWFGLTTKERIKRGYL